MRRKGTIATPPETSQKAPSSIAYQNRQSYYQGGVPQNEDDTRKRKRSNSPIVLLRDFDNDKRTNVDILTPHIPYQSPTKSPNAKKSKVVPITPPAIKEQLEQIKIILKDNHEPTSLNMFSPKEVVETISELHLHHGFPVAKICSVICDLSWVPTQTQALRRRYVSYTNDPNSDPLPWRGVKVPKEMLPVPSSNLPFYEPLEMMKNIKSLEQKGFTVSNICEAIVREDLSKEFTNHLYLEKRYCEYQNNSYLIGRMSDHHQIKYQKGSDAAGGVSGSSDETFDLPSIPPSFSTSTYCSSSTDDEDSISNNDERMIIGTVVKSNPIKPHPSIANPRDPSIANFPFHLRHRST